MNEWPCQTSVILDQFRNSQVLFGPFQCLSSQNTQRSIQGDSKVLDWKNGGHGVHGSGLETYDSVTSSVLSGKPQKRGHAEGW